MFEWVNEIEKPILPNSCEVGELRIESIDSKIQLCEMDEICQLFASFDVILDEDGFISLPTPNDKAFNTIMNKIVPHYLNVKQIFINGKLKEINVRCLKKESKKMVRELLLNGIYPIIPDLFRTEYLNLSTYPRELKRYSINKDLITPLHIKETAKIKDFFQSSFFAETGSIMLQPTGWILDDDLRDSVTIRTFSTFAKQIVLLVDHKDKSVVSLDIYG